MDSRRFWSLYFYKLYSIAVEERKKQSLLSTNIHNLSTEEDSLGQDWSSEEDAPVAESLPVIEWEEEQQSDETEY